MFSKISLPVVGLSCLALVSAAPTFSFNNNPLGNNFPTPAAGQLAAIETQAHGSIPAGNPPPPAPPKADTLTSLRLIAFNELFEVSFFAQLLQLIESGASGFVDNNYDMNQIKDAITAVLAQEELHAINANLALTKFDPAGPVQPCQYNFPVNNLADAIALASTFTDVVLGTLQDVATLMGTDGDAGLIRGIASVVGQEGEQNGFYRSLQGKIPSALPFLTASTRDFAFSALNQNFVVPGSCPNFNTINLKVFGVLNVDTKNIQPQNQDIDFSFAIPSGGIPQSWKPDCSGLELVFINQQNAPQVAKVKSINIDLHANKVSITADFPFDPATFGNGLTIAAVVLASGDLTTVDGVAAATQFGPGLIEIN
ncbi:hypothetical protein N431DRAFT_563676 [Stipitochalara longipes BDJ]|nr:hypothetical protein N431DRAFT_563676 [Stipitochalara longipes BDJ]